MMAPDDCWMGKRDRLLIWEPISSPSEPDPTNETAGALCLHRNLTGKILVADSLCCHFCSPLFC